MPVKYMSNDKKQSVLIIETDSAILKGLTDRFKKRGMLVITAKDGYEGYIRACNESPNFIVTETLLPNLNGFKVSYLLKHDERYSDIQIALLTSNDINIERQNFETCKANVIMKKPFKFSELVSKMNLNQA